MALYTQAECGFRKMECELFKKCSVYDFVPEPKTLQSENLAFSFSGSWDAGSFATKYNMLVHIYIEWKAGNFHDSHTLARAAGGSTGGRGSAVASRGMQNDGMAKRAKRFEGQFFFLSCVQ